MQAVVLGSIPGSVWGVSAGLAAVAAIMFYMAFDPGASAQQIVAYVGVNVSASLAAATALL